MITYKQGNLFEDLGDKPTLILHVCNDAGGWGSGFVLAIDKYCGNNPQTKYRKWYADREYVDKQGNKIPFKLGQVYGVSTNKPNVCVINMIAQSTPRGVSFEVDNRVVFIPPIRYQCLEECLYRIKEGAPKHYQLVGPKFGSGLAGGSWDVIAGLIDTVGLDITIYEV